MWASITHRARDVKTSLPAWDGLREYAAHLYGGSDVVDGQHVGSQAHRDVPSLADLPYFLKAAGHHPLEALVDLGLFPEQAADFAPVLAVLALLAIVLGALASYAQSDFKRLVAYSSVGHMGFVVLGVAVAAATAWTVDGSPIMSLYMPMEGGSTNALQDRSGSGHDGTPGGDPAWVATGGFDGHGYFDLDGDDYIDAGDAMPADAAYTKAAWVYWIQTVT